MIFVNSNILVMESLVFNSFVVSFIWSSFSSGKIILVALIKFIQNLFPFVKIYLIRIYHNLLFPHVVRLHCRPWTSTHWRHITRKWFESRWCNCFIQRRLRVVKCFCFSSVSSLSSIASLELLRSRSCLAIRNSWSIQFWMIKGDIWIFKFIKWINSLRFAKLFRCVLINIKWILISSRITGKRSALLILIIVTSLKCRSRTN